MKRPANTITARLEVYEALSRGELTLGQAVRRLRKVIGKTQEEYAAIINVAPRVLKDLERGVGNPTLESLRRIGRPFGLEVVYLHKKNPS